VAESSEYGASAQPVAGDLARRQFLLKAAAAGTAVWVVPSIIAIQPAGANGLHSKPPKPPEPISRHRDPIPKGASPAAQTQLPFTGDDNSDLAIAGLAATAAGASLLLLSNGRERTGLKAALADDE
jgi:hypothetical protein